MLPAVTYCDIKSNCVVNKRKCDNDKIIYLNIESLTNNFACIENLNPAMVMCSETCLTDDIKNSEIKVNGYKLIRCDSLSRHTGGVAAYIRDEIKFDVILNVSFEKHFWCLVFRTKQNFEKELYAIVYHSPNSSHATFIDKIQELVLDKLEFDKNVCLINMVSNSL